MDMGSSTTTGSGEAEESCVEYTSLEVLQSTHCSVMHLGLAWELLYRRCASTIQGAWLLTSNVAMVIPILYDNPDSPNDSTLKYGSYQPYG